VHLRHVLEHDLVARVEPLGGGPVGVVGLQVQVPPGSPTL
jgi:hypothetical protein